MGASMSLFIPEKRRRERLQAFLRGRNYDSRLHETCISKDLCTGGLWPQKDWAGHGFEQDWAQDVSTSTGKCSSRAGLAGCGQPHPLAPRLPGSEGRHHWTLSVLEVVRPVRWAPSIPLASSTPAPASVLWAKVHFSDTFWGVST